MGHSSTVADKHVHHTALRRPTDLEFDVVSDFTLSRSRTKRLYTTAVLLSRTLESAVFSELLPATSAPTEVAPGTRPGTSI